MLIERLKSFATLLFERNVLGAFFYFIEKLSFCKILFKINEWILIIIFTKKGFWGFGVLGFRV